MSDLANKLRPLVLRGLRAIDLEAPGELPEMAVRYLCLVAKWNRVYNLTAAAAPRQLVGTHLLDSLSIAPFVTGEAILDIGSGAGLPGIPLAMLFSRKKFILLDSSARKTRFMTQAKIELPLPNVTVVRSRVEDYQGQVDQMVCRAFDSVGGIVRRAGHLLPAGGTILAMKGARRETLDAPGFTQRDVTLSVPQVAGRRHVAILTREGG